MNEVSLGEPSRRSLSARGEGLRSAFRRPDAKRRALRGGGAGLVVLGLDIGAGDNQILGPVVHPTIWVSLVSESRLSITRSQPARLLSKHARANRE